MQASCKSLSIRNYDEEIPDYKDKGPSVPNVRKPLNEPKYRSRKFLRTKVLPNVRLKEVSLWEMVVTPRKRDQSSKEPSNMFMAATHIKNKSAVSFKDT